MRKKILLITVRISASLLSGALLILAYPDYDVAWLAWIALVPLMLAILGTTAKKGFFLCFIFSAVLLSGVCRWSFEVSRHTLLQHVLGILILGVPVSAFGWAFALIASRRGVAFALSTAPFLWVSLEYVRSNLSFLSLPWALLSHTQYQALPVIQISSVTGEYGVSFLVLLVNASLSAAILAGLHRLKSVRIPASHRVSQRGAVFIAVTTAALTGLVLLQGKIHLSRPIEGRSLKLSLVQGNIEQNKKWDRRYRNYIVERYEELTRQTFKDQPALVIWPEAATPGPILKDINLITRITGLIREMNTYFLIGSAEYPKFHKAPLRAGQFGNTALFFSPNGRVLGQYLKIRLVPFAEYVPYQKIIPWPRFIVPKGMRAYEVPGNEITLFDLQGSKFGALICWESIFPGLFRRFVKEGAQFMVNITNEGWFNRPTIYYQYVAMNVFRAVENRVYLVRCANTGVSCIIDPYGRVVDRVKDEEGRDIFVPGVLAGSVIATDLKTIYTRWGDWFPFLSIGCSIACLIFTISRKRRS